MSPPPPTATLFPYTTLFRSQIIRTGLAELTAMAASSSRHFTREILLEYVCYWTIKRTALPEPMVREVLGCAGHWFRDRKSTRLNSSHVKISYAVFCLKKKKS